MKLTRRELAALVTAGQAAAQQPPALPRNPAEELEAAAGRIRSNAAALAKFNVPMDTEPAFVFKA